MNFLKLTFTLLLFYVSTQCVVGQSLVINEVMSSNSTVIQDEDGDYVDWVEIFNTTNQQIDLQGYHLSDDPGELSKWTFPSVIISPDSFIVVFASGKDRSILGKELHSNFKIKANGESIYLSKNGTVWSTFSGQPIATDKSVGAYPDGSQFYATLDSPSPGAHNRLPIGVSDVVNFSIKGGLVTNSDQLVLKNSNSNYQIRFTADGSSPRATSPLFPSQGVLLDSTLLSTTRLREVPMSLPASQHIPVGPMPQVIVVRAASFDNSGNAMSNVTSYTFFNQQLADIPEGLPVISLMVDPNHLVDYDSGLFVLGKHWDPNTPNNTGNFFQKGIAWERPIHLEYFEDGFQPSLKQDAGLRMHGYSSRTPPQKAMRLYARSSYGASDFNYELFPNRSFDTYRRLTLKPFLASWGQYGPADYLSSNLARTFNVDYLSTKPVTLYINGEYWGIYFLSERIDEDYLKDISGYEEDSIDLIEGWQGLVSEGNGKAYGELLDAVSNHDLSLPLNYARVDSLMDIDNFIDHQIIQMFMVNYDWPQNNMKCWKSREPGSKWRWIVFDGDACFSDVTFDMFAHSLDSNPSDWAKLIGTEFLRQLIKNEQFKQRFFDRLDEVIQSNLLAANTQPIASDISEKLNNHIPYQSARFGRPTDKATWEVTTSYIMNFLAQRSCNMTHNARKYFEQALIPNHCFNENNTVSNIQIFPNPTSGKFTVGLNSETQFTSQLSIYSSLGSEISSQPIDVLRGINGYTLDLSANVAGMYIITISSETQKYSKRVIVY